MIKKLDRNFLSYALLLAARNLVMDPRYHLPPSPSQKSTRSILTLFKSDAHHSGERYLSLVSQCHASF